MKNVRQHKDWPASWSLSNVYDQVEIYGNMSNPGYAYAYANRRTHTLEMIRQAVQPGARILDVAAAQGNFSLTLAELGYKVVWNDIRKELVDYVKLKYEEGILEFAPGNIFSVELESGFDLILISEVIEHVAHPDKFLQRIAQLTKPGGYIVMTTPNGEYFKTHLPKFSQCSDPSRFEDIQFGPNSGDHIFLLHADEIEALARQAGLRVLELRVFTNPLTNGHSKLGRILRIAPRASVKACEYFTGHLPLNVQRKIHATMAVLFTRAE